MGYENVPDSYFNIVKMKEDVGLLNSNQRNKDEKGGHEIVIYNNAEDRSNTKFKNMKNNIETGYEQNSNQIEKDIGTSIEDADTGNNVYSNRTKKDAGTSIEDTGTGNNVCAKVKEVLWSDNVCGKKTVEKLELDKSSLN